MRPDLAMDPVEADRPAGAYPTASRPGGSEISGQPAPGKAQMSTRMTFVPGRADFVDRRPLWGPRHRALRLPDGEPVAVYLPDRREQGDGFDDGGVRAG